MAALTATCIVIVAVAGEQNPADRFAGVELTVVPAAGRVHMVQRSGGSGNVGLFAGCGDDAIGLVLLRAVVVHTISYCQSSQA